LDNFLKLIYGCTEVSYFCSLSLILILPLFLPLSQSTFSLLTPSWASLPLWYPAKVSFLLVQIRSHLTSSSHDWLASPHHLTSLFTLDILLTHFGPEDEGCSSKCWYTTKIQNTTWRNNPKKHHLCVINLIQNLKHICTIQF
jgi:hypothetical protein